MNSQKAILFLKMQAKITADITDVKHIDRDSGQLEKPNPPVLYPCALISFPENLYDQMQGFQNAKRTVKIKLATNRLQNTSAETPQTQLEEGLNFWELEQQFYEAFQYWDADGTLADVFIRKSDEEVNDNDNGLNEVSLIFEFTYVDSSAG